MGQLHPGKVALAQGVPLHGVTPNTLNLSPHDQCTELLLLLLLLRCHYWYFHTSHRCQPPRVFIVSVVVVFIMMVVATVVRRYMIVGHSFLRADPPGRAEENWGRGGQTPRSHSRDRWRCHDGDTRRLPSLAW